MNQSFFWSKLIVNPAMRCKIEVIVRVNMSCRVNSSLVGGVKSRCECLLSPARNVKHVCNKRVFVSALPKRCICEEGVCLM